MKPYELYNKDCRKMAELADNTIQCVVTSPAYWGLRKYSGEQDLIWGGDKDCVHEWIDYNARTYQKGQGMDELAKVWKTGGKPKAGETELANGDKHKLSHCSACGAWKGAYGLEPQPDCGRPFMKLRDDLTPKEKEYALSELRKFGAI